jgi:hypothetical protein
VGVKVEVPLGFVDTDIFIPLGFVKKMLFFLWVLSKNCIFAPQNRVEYIFELE